jgi:oligopeptide/dipeptide ABC transporter ATP-binding protein
VSLLRVRDLVTWFETPRGVLRAVDGVSLDLDAGSTLGVVGESGSGKSVLTRSIMAIQPRGNLARYGGEVTFDGADLLTLRPSALREVWGNGIGIVPQDPTSSLNPVMRVGRQITENLRRGGAMTGRAADRVAVELLEQVGIAAPARRLREYPHQLSGGMRQRVVIAMALAGQPQLLIADEPTTALDVTVQAEILALLRTLQQERDMAMILVSHDLAVVGGLADEIMVMYAGRTVEQGPARMLLESPRMPYTAALLRSTPRLEHPRHHRLDVIPGRPPDLVSEITGCPFRPRCDHAVERCATEAPALTTEGSQSYACWEPIAHGR